MEESVETDPKFPLKRNSTSGEIGSNPDHEYYFLVKLQLMVTERKYGIFAMYTKTQLNSCSDRVGFSSHRKHY